MISVQEERRKMPPIKKVVAGSRNRKRKKRMNATTYATTRNVLVREITMPVVFCKDCKYWNKHHFVDIYVCSIHNKEGQYPYLLFEMSADDFCSKGEKRDE